MRMHPDWSEWLNLLNSNAVEYLVVGGIAVGVHGFPRYTEAIDDEASALLFFCWQNRPSLDLYYY